jgi:methylated-DNA-[protein]-cysteine S-methyltransferase
MTTIGATSSTRHAVLESPLGPLSAVRDDSGITGLYFPGHWTRPDRSSFGPRAESPIDAGFDEVAVQLDEYFAGQRRTFELPLAIRGDEAQQTVWRALRAIPYGQTTTYGALAAAVGHGLDARDIGALVGRNPLSILIPCHRVLGAGGKLTGYAGGLRRKRYLLDLERCTLDPSATLW